MQWILHKIFAFFRRFDKWVQTGRCRGPCRHRRRWRKHSVCMTNALAGVNPSPPCRLRAETFRQHCRKVAHKIGFGHIAKPDFICYFPAMLPRSFRPQAAWGTGVYPSKQYFDIKMRCLRQRRHRRRWLSPRQSVLLTKVCVHGGRETVKT